MCPSIFMKIKILYSILQVEVLAFVSHCTYCCVRFSNIQGNRTDNHPSIIQSSYRIRIGIYCMQHLEWECFSWMILKISPLVYNLVVIKKPYLYFGHIAKISSKCFHPKTEQHPPSPMDPDGYCLGTQAPRLKSWGLDVTSRRKVIFMFDWKWLVAS